VAVFLGLRYLLLARVASYIEFLRARCGPPLWIVRAGSAVILEIFSNYYAEHEIWLTDCLTTIWLGWQHAVLSLVRAMPRTPRARGPISSHANPGRGYHPGAVRHAAHRGSPWTIRQAAASVQSSIHSFAARLTTTSGTTAALLPFIGTLFTLFCSAI